MNFDTLIWRFRILRSKAMGQLPALPWSRVPTLLTQPIEKWDYRYFAMPVKDRGLPGMVPYETAIGPFYGRPEDQSSIGCVIVEELCRIYRSEKSRVGEDGIAAR